MIFEDIDKIQEAIEKNDILYLRSLIKPSKPKKRRKKVRSALMVSAHRAKHLNKLDEIEADIAIINLEDGVAPRYKEAALYAALVFISNAPETTPMLVVRINPLQELGEEEIKELNLVFPDAIRVPKITTQREIDRARELIHPDIDLHLSIETKEAFKDLERFDLERVQACYLGILDLLADLDIPQSTLKIANPTIDYILSRFLIGCKSAEVLPISFVYQDYKNLEEFRHWCRHERELGFRAKGCISPDQVKIANEIFGERDIERARHIVERFEKMAAQGITGFVDEEYGFIDEPIYKDALNILKDR